VRPEDWPLLGFKWRGKWYYERALPFGLKSACRLWELYATALQHFIERMLGIRHVLHYIDDFLFVVKELRTAHEHLRKALGLCTRLGLPMAADKTEGPSTCLTFLGIQIDTVAMNASLSADRLERLHSLLGDWERKSHVTITELKSLEGVLQWCTNVIHPGRSFLERIRAFCKTKGRTGEGPHSIPAEVRADIGWWFRFVREWNGVSVLYDRTWQEADKLLLYTDACERGFGARFGNRWIEAKWTTAQYNRACNTDPNDTSKKVREPIREPIHVQHNSHLQGRIRHSHD
jgi:hypothetical protein